MIRRARHISINRFNYQQWLIMQVIEISTKFSQFAGTNHGTRIFYSRKKVLNVLSLRQKNWTRRQVFNFNTLKIVQFAKFL